MLTSLGLWLIIFFVQPHKEERFLFPIFPLIAILSSVGAFSVLHILPAPRFFGMLFVLLFIGASVSRGYALHRNYGASIETYKNFENYLLLSPPEMGRDQVSARNDEAIRMRMSCRSHFDFVSARSGIVFRPLSLCPTVCEAPTTRSAASRRAFCVQHSAAFCLNK